MFCRNCGKEVNKNIRFCKNCGTEVLRQKSFSRLTNWVKYNKTSLIVTFSIIAGVAILTYIADDGSNYYNYDSDTVTSISSVQSDSSGFTSVGSIDQNQIAAMVVNIICGTDTFGSGGSGTIITSDGVVLTNSHIIPQDENGIPEVNYCMVTLPDSQGKIKEIYLGEPIIIPYLSNQYDLAFISIDEPYVDEDGLSYGKYGRTFSSLIDTGCENDSPRLGEKIRVFGYPEISAGGYFLTITDGLISSLPNDGTIFTSAKINHGSSGGLAVDENGCMVGVPSMISGDENESLGVLISNEVVYEFMEKLQSLDNLLK